MGQILDGGTVKITEDTLTALDACAEGLEWFNAAFPDGFDGDWTADHQRWLIAAGGARWLGWACGLGVLPAWSMAKQNWSRADLRRANLRGANLSGADLYGADLRGADLRWANLRWADLYGANLRGADLYGADLRGADLRWADLSGADLSGADLSGALGLPPTEAP